MPRRAVPPTVAAVLPPAPISPLVQKLRQDWRWAGISQFMNTFADAFGLSDWDIEALEQDIDGPEDSVLPELIVKLLYALTWNRQITRDNVFEHLHKQWLKREPDTNPFGSLEEPHFWETLGLSQKVEALWRLCEWQLAEPARLRSLLKTEDDPASWRVDPVGWDKSGNTYFLFDDNRLWVQRARPQPPRPPKMTSLKAKRAQRSQKRSKPAPRRSHKKRTPVDEVSPPPEPVQAEPVSGPRKRTQVKFYGNVTPTVEALKRASQPDPSPKSDRATRSSARYASSPETPSKPPSRPPPLPRGTRVSRRLRNVDDEWQQIPDDWLGPTDAKSKAPSGSKAKAKLAQDDDESDLSELTDEEEHQAELEATHIGQEADGAREESPLSEAPEENSPPVVFEDPVDDTDYKPEDEADEAEEEPEAAGEREESASVTPQSNNNDTDNEDSFEKSSVNGKSPEPAKEDSQLDERETRDEEPANDEPMVEDEPKGQLKVEGEPQDEAMADDEPQGEPKAEQDADAEANVKAEKEDDPVETDEVKLAVKEAAQLPEGFIEWEAVCVTLYEWKTWPEQFAQSRDRDEKALYKLLVNDVAPQIIEALTIKEQERLKQEAINNRKRSSRIATRELAKEEEMRREQAQREMEERMEKLREEQALKERQEHEHFEREQAREARLREREERIATREAAVVARMQAEAAEKERAERKRERRKRRRDGEEVETSSDEGVTASRPRTRQATPVKSAASSVKDGSNGQSWELKCEVCKLHGWNLDDDSDVVSCDDCGRWQHVKCHDRRDIAAGRGIRDWDKVDFRCLECEQRKNKRQRVDAGPTKPLAQANGTAPPPRQPAPAAQPERRLSATQYPVPYPSHQQHPLQHQVPVVQGYQQGPAPYQQQRPLNHSPSQAANGHRGHTHTPPLHQTSPQARYHPMPAQPHAYQQQPHSGYYASEPPNPVHSPPNPAHSPPTEYRRPEYAHYPRDGHPHDPRDLREAFPHAEYPRAEYHPPPPYPPSQRQEYAPRHEAYPYLGQHALVNGQGHAGHQPPHAYPPAGYAHPYSHTSPPPQQYGPRASQSPQQQAVLPSVKYAGEMSEQRRG